MSTATATFLLIAATTANPQPNPDLSVSVHTLVGRYDSPQLCEKGRNQLYKGMFGPHTLVMVSRCTSSADTALFWLQAQGCAGWFHNDGYLIEYRCDRSTLTQDGGGWLTLPELSAND
jgi:hypothetical protein